MRYKSLKPSCRRVEVVEISIFYVFTANASFARKVAAIVSNKRMDTDAFLQLQIGGHAQLTKHPAPFIFAVDRNYNHTLPNAMEERKRTRIRESETMHARSQEKCNATRSSKSDVITSNYMRCLISNYVRWMHNSRIYVILLQIAIGILIRSMEHTNAHTNNQANKCKRKHIGTI